MFITKYCCTFKYRNKHVMILLFHTDEIIKLVEQTLNALKVEYVEVYDSTDLGDETQSVSVEFEGTNLEIMIGLPNFDSIMEFCITLVDDSLEQKGEVYIARTFQDLDEALENTTNDIEQIQQTVTLW